MSARRRREAVGRAKCRDPLEDVAAQFLEFAGEAHDVHQRRAQVVADDIGEALDFFIGLAQIGGAFVDRGLEIDIVVAQLVSASSRARAERRTRKIEMPASAITRPEPATVTDRGQLLRAVGGRGSRRKQPVLLDAHRGGNLADLLNGIAGAGLAQHRDAAGHIVTF